MTKCNGCGIELQYDNKEKIGYANSIDAKMCRRCFEMVNYNKIPDIGLSSQEFKNIISKIKNEEALVFMVVDIFDFENSFIEDIVKYIGKNELVIIANKKDLLPKAVTDNKIKIWIHTFVKKMGIEVCDIIVTSFEKNKGIDEITEIIEGLNYSKNYIVGITNTGKSTLVNKLTKVNKVTTSYYPSTTLNEIVIDLNTNQKIIDTPGIINENQIQHLLEAKTYKVLTPRKEIRPKTYQLNPDQTLFMSGFCQMNFINGEKTGFTVYMSNEIYIHRTKLENAEEFKKQHLVNGLLNPPTELELEKIKKWETKKIIIKEKKTDIIIAGLGFITINKITRPLELEIIVPEQIKVSTRISII